MLDTCSIAHPGGETTDDDTGTVTQAYGAPFYAGRCKVQARDCGAN